MPSFSFASSMMGRFLASWAIWMSVFGLVCCDAGISDFLSREPPHPEERPQAASRRVGPVLLLPTLRDAPLCGAPQGEVSLSQVYRAPTARFADLAQSPAPTLGPSAGCTRVTLMRPSGTTTVKPSASTATTSPYLPPMPLGSRAGIGVMSKIRSVLPSSVVQAPGAGLQPRTSGSIWRHDLPQSMRAMS